jgi:hypothetical protein
MLPKMTLSESMAAPLAVQKGGQPRPSGLALGIQGATASAVIMPGSPRRGDHEYRDGQP